MVSSFGHVAKRSQITSSALFLRVKASLSRLNWTPIKLAALSFSKSRSGSIPFVLVEESGRLEQT